MRYPEGFFSSININLIYPETKPNTAHIALAKLEEIGKLNIIKNIEHKLII